MKTLAALTLACTVATSMADDIVIYKYVSTNTFRDHEVSYTAGLLPYVGTSKETNTTYLVRSLTPNGTGELVQAAVELTTAGQFKFYYVQHSTRRDFNTATTNPYNGHGFYRLALPRTSLRVQYEVDCLNELNFEEDPALPNDIFGWVVSAYGSEKVVKLKNSLKTVIAPTSIKGTQQGYNRSDFFGQGSAVATGAFTYLYSGAVSYTLSTTLSDAANHPVPVVVGGVTYNGGTIARGVYEVAKSLEKARYVLDETEF